MSSPSLTRLELLARISASSARSKDKFKFFDDYLLWQTYRDAARAGEELNLSIEEKKRAYLVKSNIRHVYFLEGVGTGLVKIGKTTHINKRISALKNQSPIELRLLLSIEYDDDLERRLHEYFSDERAHGEWFEASGRMKAFMRSYLDGGLEWLVDEVGDAPGIWMNARGGVDHDTVHEDMLANSPLMSVHLSGRY